MIGEVFPEKPQNAVIVNLEEVWKSISGELARVEDLEAYEAHLQQLSSELAKKPGIEIALYGRAPIWLYVVGFHTFHWARRVYVLSLIHI